jgi:hypothetical protein
MANNFSQAERMEKCARLRTNWKQQTQAPLAADRQGVGRHKAELQKGTAAGLDDRLLRGACLKMRGTK